MKLTIESSVDLLFEISIQIREKRLSPRRAPKRSLLPLSPKRTQVRLKSLLYLVWLTPDPFRAHGRPSVQECRLRLKRPAALLGRITTWRRFDAIVSLFFGRVSLRWQRMAREPRLTIVNNITY